MLARLPPPVYVFLVMVYIWICGGYYSLLSLQGIVVLCSIRHVYSDLAFRRLPTLPSLVSRQLSCCCIHTTSVLRAKSEPIINGYLAFLNLADPLQLLVPDFVTSLYTLPTCVICEQLFRWDKQLFALHVITYYSMPLATAFTCSILLCRCKDLLYGCIVTVFHPLDITRSHTGQCLLCLTPSCSHPGCY